MDELGASPLFVTQFGRGRPLLCLHGIEAHGLRYVGLAARLTDVHVVAPDVRGHGHSPASGPWTMAQNVADLAPILESLGPQTVVLGHSYGGLIAWELARAMPGALAGLVLVDPAIGVSSTTAEEGIALSGTNMAWPDERAALEALLVQRQPTAWWAAALEFANALERTEDGHLRPIVRKEAVTAGWAQMHEPMRSTSWRGPTLLLEAALEEGRYVSAASATAIRDDLGDALDHRLLDLTHTIPSDHPDLLAEIVTAFLDKRPR
ncbi:MAG: lipase [Chloroflexota bacterium]|jgi:lipase|nr:lipase [Chloroflexota bacterium]